MSAGRFLIFVHVLGGSWCDDWFQLPAIKVLHLQKFDQNTSLIQMQRTLNWLAISFFFFFYWGKRESEPLLLRTPLRPSLPPALLWRRLTQTYSRHVSSDFLMSATDGLCHDRLMVILGGEKKKCRLTDTTWTDLRPQSNCSIGVSTFFILMKKTKQIWVDWCMWTDANIYYIIYSRHLFCFAWGCVLLNRLFMVCLLTHKTLVRYRHTVVSVGYHTHTHMHKHTHTHSVFLLAAGSSSAWFAVLVLLLAKWLRVATPVHSMIVTVTLSPPVISYCSALYNIHPAPFSQAHLQLHHTYNIRWL